MPEGRARGIAQSKGTSDELKRALSPIRRFAIYSPLTPALSPLRGEGELHLAGENIRSPARWLAGK